MYSKIERTALADHFMGRRKCNHRKVTMIKYLDPETNQLETYPLNADGRHTDQSLNARSIKKPYTKSLSAGVIMGMKYTEPTVRLEYTMPQFQAPPPPQRQPATVFEIGDIPLFSAMWLNNPDYAK